MLQVSFRVKKNFNLKKRLGVILSGNYKPFLVLGTDELIKDNISNIAHQRTPSGGRLKRNAPSTLKRKAQLGKGQLSLIWDRILINRGTWLSKTTKKSGRVFLKAVRAKIGAAVRNMGYDFFGISVKARVKILKRFRAFILRGLK